MSLQYPDNFEKKYHTLATEFEKHVDLGMTKYGPTEDGSYAEVEFFIHDLQSWLKILSRLYAQTLIMTEDEYDLLRRMDGHFEWRAPAPWRVEVSLNMEDDTPVRAGSGRRQEWKGFGAPKARAAIAFSAEDVEAASDLMSKYL